MDALKRSATRLDMRPYLSPKLFILYEAEPCAVGGLAGFTPHVPCSDHSRRITGETARPTAVRAQLCIVITACALTGEQRTDLPSARNTPSAAGTSNPHAGDRAGSIRPAARTGHGRHDAPSRFWLNRAI